MELPGKKLLLILAAFLVLLTPGCLNNGENQAVVAPVEPEGETQEREFFVGRDLKDDQACLIVAIAEKKQTISSAFVHVESVKFTIVDEGESSELTLPFDRDFSVYRFHSQMLSALAEITEPEGAVSEISLQVTTARATVRGEILDMYLPGRKIALQFDPPKPAGVPLAPLCLAQQLQLNEGGVSLSPALFQFRALGGSLAGVMGLSVESTELED